MDLHAPSPTHAQFPTRDELLTWLVQINEAIGEALDASYAEGERIHIFDGMEAFVEVRKTAPNRKCFDCHAPDPDWTSVNFGTVICALCAAVHVEHSLSNAKVGAWRLWLLRFLSVFECG